MAYSDDAVQAKLNALNESQDSIVANAQWIMFHRRHAVRTASLWLARLTDSPMPKRLNLIYLANEVVQQSRARGKQDFMLAFEPIIADATALAYKGASQDVQGKLRRVVDVWRQRGIFDRAIMEGVDARLAEADKARSGGKMGGGARLGGSLFGGGASGSVPAELDAVSKSQASLNKAQVFVPPAVSSANAEYAKITDPSLTLPTPPVYAARLSAVMKELATAQGAVEASIKARKELLSGLEKLVESNRASLAEDEASFAEISTRKDSIEAKKRDVEDGIMRGLSAPNTPGLGSDNGNSAGGNSNGHTSSMEPERPEAEGFTPPPPDVETFTPPSEELTLTGDPAPLLGDKHISASTTGANLVQEQPPTFNEPPPQVTDSSAAANDFLSNFILPSGEKAGAPPNSGELGESEGLSGDPRMMKRRKMSHKSNADDEEDIFGSTDGAGVDEDSITAMLGP